MMNDKYIFDHTITFLMFGTQDMGQICKKYHHQHDDVFVSHGDAQWSAAERYWRINSRITGLHLTTDTDVLIQGGILSFIIVFLGMHWYI